MHMCTYLFLLVIYVVKLLGHSICVYHTLVLQSDRTELYVSSAVYEMSSCSTSLSTFDTVSL